MDLDALYRFRLPEVEHAYTTKDSILYALGLGYGSNSTDPDQLSFVYEAGLKVVPTMVVVIAHPGFWVREPSLGIDWVKVLHGEQSVRIHQPLQPEGRLRGVYEIPIVEDKGLGKGLWRSPAAAITVARS